MGRFRSRHRSFAWRSCFTTLLFVAQFSRVPAPWVPLRVAAPGEQDAPTVGNLGGSVPLTSLRLHLGPYDANAVGNLLGARMVSELRSARNHALVAPIGVGTPSQPLTCMLDASGGYSWIPSQRCSTCAADTQEQSHFFNASLSSTFEPKVVETPFGDAPLSAEIFYGGGSAKGFIFRDKVTIGKVQMPKQSLILAEEGGADARKVRGWDGVCGVGWTEDDWHDDPDDAPLYVKLGKIGLQKLIVVVPSGVGGGALYVGKMPATSVVDHIQWIPALDRRTAWILTAQVASGSPLIVRDVQMVLEFGTSFLLVPTYSYLFFVRSILPTFDQRCGADPKAGNLVVCKCRAREESKILEAGRVVRIKIGDQNFFLSAEDLFDPVLDTPDLCILQIQQRPASSGVDDPYGLLGAPVLHGEGDAGLASAFGLPPSWDMGLGTENPAELENMIENLTEELEEQYDYGDTGDGAEQTGFTDLVSGSDPDALTRTKEITIESLGDGNRCETEVVRDSLGKVLFQSSRVVGKDLRPLPSVNEIGCVRTKAKPRRAIAQAFDSSALQSRHEEPDLWVVGEIFLRKHTIALDFENGQVGIAPAPAPRVGGQVPSSRQQELVGGVESLEGFDGGSSVQQPREQAGMGGQLGVPDGSRGAPPSVSYSLPISTRPAGSSEPSVSGFVAGTLLAVLIGGVLVAFTASMRRRPDWCPGVAVGSFGTGRHIAVAATAADLEAMREQEPFVDDELDEEDRVRPKLPLRDDDDYKSAVIE